MSLNKCWMPSRSGMGQQHLMPMLFLSVLLVVVYLNQVNAIMCYICNVKDHWQCSSLKSYPRRRQEFLFFCNTSCTTMYRSGEVGKTLTNIYTTRGCDPLDECERNGTICCVCHTDECNMGIECLMMGYRAGSTGTSISSNIDDIIKMVAIIWLILSIINNIIRFK